MREWLDIINEAQDPMTNPYFREWFRGSHVIDGAGHPLLVYRGEHGHNSDPTVFHTRRGSLSFGTIDAANTYASSPNDTEDMNKPPAAPRVIPCYLSIKNPVFNSPGDPFIDLDKLADIIGHEAVVQITQQFDKQIENTTAWEEVRSNYESPYEAYMDGADLCIYCFELLDEPYYVNMFRSLGYDGAIHMGTAETMYSIEYKIFDVSQARSVFALSGVADSSQRAA